MHDFMNIYMFPDTFLLCAGKVVHPVIFGGLSGNIMNIDELMNIHNNTTVQQNVKIIRGSPVICADYYSL